MYYPNISESRNLKVLMKSISFQEVNSLTSDVSILSERISKVFGMQLSLNSKYELANLDVLVLVKVREKYRADDMGEQDSLEARHE